MAISLADLPAKYRQQAAVKFLLKNQGKQPAKPSKYHNVKTDIGKHHFDSRKEARRFMELLPMWKAGIIKDLRLQQDFTLQEAYTTPEGERVRAIRYKADFVYYRRSAAGEWEKVVEDVKSRPTRTKTYIMKRKMMLDRLGIRIEET